jgi:hypothetical protein
MASETMKAPHRGDGGDLRNSDLAINSEHIRLDALRAQYLAEICALPPCTAALIAELAFGEGGSR